MSKKYWQDRFIEEEERLNKIATDEFRRQQLEYERAIARMNKDIEVWYNRIAKNNDVSLAEAKKMLNDKELKEFRWTLDEYIKHGKENGIDKNWNKELENASARVHIERLEAMKLQVRGEIEKLYNGRESGFESYLKNLYKDQYNRTAFQIAKGTGVGTNIYSLNDKLVNTVIKKPWAPDGKNFSDRIWEDKDKLINTLHTEMTQAFIRGDSLEKLADKIAEKMKVSKANASRLVYTESAAYSSIARFKSYQDLGVEKYEIVATLDNRTSDICQDMDGKVFDLKDYEVGVTANPFHVRCRTTTAPYFDDMEGERAARNETTGETEYVPADMKYSEWKEKYLNNSSGNRTIILGEDIRYRKLGNIENTGYNSPVDLLRKYEQKIVRDTYESAMVVTKNGDIYIAKGDRSSISLHKMDMPYEGSYLTHNHPKGLHEWGFSNDDFTFFTNYKLKYMAAIDEKYIHELSEGLFEMKDIDLDIDPRKLENLNFENVAEIFQVQKAKDKKLKYRRKRHAIKKS